MELVVGASEATMKSLLGKLGGLLSQEYTLNRGVNGDLQYINDELRTMQSFLRAVGKGHGHGHDDLMDDWMKQIRDITYDIEDCIDDSADRLHGLRSDVCCYFLVNSVYEVLTWWPRRDVASRISVLKMRAQQIGERRNRYGVNNPETGAGGAPTGTRGTAVGFDAADNQEESLQLVAFKGPVGVEEHMRELEKPVTCIVGSAGWGRPPLQRPCTGDLGTNSTTGPWSRCLRSQTWGAFSEASTVKSGRRQAMRSSKAAQPRAVSQQPSKVYGVTSAEARQPSWPSAAAAPASPRKTGQSWIYSRKTSRSTSRKTVNFVQQIHQGCRIMLTCLLLDLN
ncbi:hypothetical protein CFC21_077830 [Triticum aestivum]|uniref:Disease resistance N-terminal domain-containing protein n=2 Tax=Triticum aestivum TaxID=4565 RepID=A0A9R1L026_WHEAT|nr:hypothetical protein CFC21_077830 [Triticum aestivum]